MIQTHASVSVSLTSVLHINILTQNPVVAIAVTTQCAQIISTSTTQRVGATVKKSKPVLQDSILTSTRVSANVKILPLAILHTILITTNVSVSVSLRSVHHINTLTIIPVVVNVIPT